MISVWIKTAPGTGLPNPPWQTANRVTTERAREPVQSNEGETRRKPFSILTTELAGVQFPKLFPGLQNNRLNGERVRVFTTARWRIRRPGFNRTPSQGITQESELGKERFVSLQRG